MTGLGTGNNDALVNWVCPVNWLAPLNRGLIGWWLCLPGAMGGKKLQDLTRRSDGTLTNMDPPTDWKTALLRPGGYGAVDFDGSNDSVVAPFIPSFNVANVTVACWARMQSGPTYASPFFRPPTTIGMPPYNLYSIQMHRNAFGQPPGFCIGIGGSESVASGSSALSASVWYHMCGSYNGVTQKLFINGVEVASTSITGAIDSSTQPVYIGYSDGAGGAGSYLGMVDDVRIHDYGMTPDQVSRLYHASRTGYQAELRRVRRPWAYKPAATFDPATFPYSNQEGSKPKPWTFVDY